MSGSRLRRWLRRFSIVAVVTLVLASVAGLWLLRSDGGRDWLLARVRAQLPADATLSWDRLDGTLSGPLAIEGLHYRDGKYEFRAKSLRLDYGTWPLLSGRLAIHRLRIEGAVLTLPRDDEAFKFPRWPGLLPTLRMPMTVAVAQLEVVGFKLRRESETLLVVSKATGAFTLSDGALSITRLRVDSDRGQLALDGDYRPHDNFQTNLIADLKLPAAVGATPAHARLKANGDLDDFRLVLNGAAPAPLQAALTLRGGRKTPSWTFSAKTTRLQLEQLGLAEDQPLAFDLRASGVGGRAQMQGPLARGGQHVRIEPSVLVLESGVLRVQPLRLALDAGRIEVIGTAALENRDPVFDVRIASKAWRLVPESASARPVQVSGQVDWQGRWKDWRLSGVATLLRGNEQATLTFAGRGDDRHLALEKLLAATPTGKLEGTGELQWQPNLTLSLESRLDAFDPGYFLPDYPGALSGALTLAASQAPNGDWRGSGNLKDLRGRLRGRAVAGEANAQWDGHQGEGDLRLQLGASRIEAGGRFGSRLDLQATFSPLDLADLLPNAAGRLQGKLQVSGDRAHPDWRSDLSGSGLRWRDQRVGQIDAEGVLPGRGRAGRLQLRASAVELGGQAFDTLALEATGSLSDLGIHATLVGAPGRVRLEATAKGSGGRWQGQLQGLAFQPSRGAAWTLQSPAAFAYADGNFRIANACLQAGAPGGQLCVQATGSTASIAGRALPLALIEPWWTPSVREQPLRSFGSVDLDGRFARSDAGAWRGDARLRSAAGGLQLVQTSPREVFSYSNLQVDAQLQGDRYSLTLAAQLAEQGRLSASLNGGFSAQSAIAGKLDFEMRRLTWLELTSPDLADPKGRLDGHLTLAGTRAVPALGGDARLSGFSAELPALGVTLREGDIVLRGESGGVASLSGSVRSGRGQLGIAGTLDLANADRPLQLTLRGEDITVAKTADLDADISPDLRLDYNKGVLKITGSVIVPRARIDLERLDGSVDVSEDVVVLDPREPATSGSFLVDTDVMVKLGEQVRLKGFGLDGTLGGSLRLRDQPGRVALASGALEVRGTYRAYGQSLTLQRGRLAYANSAIDNPLLDILADRQFEDVTVGVRVRGSAQAPRTTITSTPAMESSEALAWLVLGRPLSTASGAESRQLSAQALALSAGGNLLAQQIGVKLGLDEAGISESRALGGAVFSVGKKISPRLFVSYGVSLLGSGQVMTLKYLIAHGFDVSIESGRETSGSLNWRKEK